MENILIDQMNLEKDIEEAAKQFLYGYDSVNISSVISAFEHGAKSPEAKAYHTKDMYSEEDLISFGEYVSNSNTYHFTIVDLYRNWKEFNKEVATQRYLTVLYSKNLGKTIIYNN